MNVFKKIIISLVAILWTTGCSQKEFAAGDASPSASVTTQANGSSTNPANPPTTTGPATQPTTPSGSAPVFPSLAGIACGYPVYTGQIKLATNCGRYNFSVDIPRSALQVTSGRTYRFSIYEVSSETHGVAQSRQIGTQYVKIASGLAANSVDLELQAYEPVHWSIFGNVAAVRSVHIRGYHCADISGVPEEKVSMVTYETGTSANINSLPLSSNVVSEISFYQGACAPGRIFTVQ